MYQTILIGAKLSQESHAFICQAHKIAKKFSNDIYLLHTIEPPQSSIYAAALGFAEFVDPIKDDAQLVMKTLGEELSIPTEKQIVEIGSAKSVIIDAADTIAADLIIIGCHCDNRLPHVTGTTTEMIMKTAHCDVITLRHTTM